MKKMKILKRNILQFFLLCCLGFSCFADSFTNAIQDLAIQTACIGQYSATQAGGGWYDDPMDYYVPKFMAERFREMSGNMTRTTTFYGVCFDYAQFAWNDIDNYKSWYNEQGMFEGQFWIAGVHENSNEIILSSPTEKAKATSIQNGVYIRTFGTKSYKNIKTHRLYNEGERAEHHAWLWVMRADGVWFWIDPTWTDNLGYVVYGYVNNGEEIQCRPDEIYCIEYPSKLNNLPLPPVMGNKKAPSKTSNSTNREETINDAVVEGFEKQINKTFIDVNYNGMDSYIALILSANIPYESLRNKNVNFNRIGIGLDLQFGLDSIAMINGIEYLRNKEDGNNLHGIIFDFNYERRLFNNLAWYIGGGVGLRGDFSNKENIYVPKIYEKNSLVALKAETGFVVNISVLCAKVEISFDNIIGLNVGAGIGFGMEI